MNQFRPIALANFKLKIITKMIADRLATILPYLISRGKSGFVNGRKIRDNICLASEAMNLLNQKSFWGNVALKSDILNAFDSLSSSFLLKTLSAFGFYDKFCLWIKVILELAHLSIGMNGNQIVFFNCSNDVRQGDPLSPLLFYFAEEVLSRGIYKLVEDNQISLMKGPRNILVPSHTLYANDIFIFCKGDLKSINVISNVLSRYARWSSQTCNAAKSLIFAGAMDQHGHKSLADILAFTMAFTSFIYLGALIFIGKSKNIHFQFIADKIRFKLAT